MKMMYHRIMDRLFPPPPEDVSDALLALQARRVLREVPILNVFGMFAIAIAVIAIWSPAMPAFQLALPALGMAFSFFRVLQWRSLHYQTYETTRIPALLRRAAIANFTLMVTGTSWVIAGYFNPAFNNREYLPLFMGLCAIVSCNCFAAIPRTALIALFLGLLPNALVCAAFGGSLGLMLSAFLIIVGIVSFRQVCESHVQTVDRLLLEHRIREQANTDVLTGLPNRRALLAQFENALQSANAGCRFGIAVIDLDGFKQVNDTHGHLIGDYYLTEVAQRFAGACREGDVVARFGGDEFAVLFRMVSGPDDIAARAAGLMTALVKPATIMGTQFRMAASLGHAVWPDEGRTIAELITAADNALYAAKRSPRCGGRGLSNSIAA